MVKPASQQNTCLLDGNSKAPSKLPHGNQLRINTLSKVAQTHQHGILEGGIQ